MTQIYGIPNCNTVRNARKWLESHDLSVPFIDFRKDNFNEKTLQAWLKLVDFEKMINRRSQGWQSLSPEQQQDLIENQNLSILVEIPTIIKRPVLVNEHQILFGFKTEDYQVFFGLE